MDPHEVEPGTRRHFVRTLTLTAAAGLVGLSPGVEAAEPPPETASVRFSTYPASCIAAQWVAEELLRAEGFIDIRYVAVPDDIPSGRLLATGRVDFSIEAAPVIPVYVDGGAPLVTLAGLHPGCFELFAQQSIRTIRGLKDRSVSVPAEGDERHVFVSAMLAHVGLDPRRDVKWDFRPSDQGLQRFVEGKVDAYLGFPPDPQELRARKIGRVIVDTLTDRPWSQYFCCMLTANRTFVRDRPAATMRVLRAVLKAVGVCAAEPERVARMITEKGYESRQDYAAQVLKQLPYARWREYPPDDTLRFYALRLHEAGLIKSNPKKVIADAGDWRFLNELKKELKG